MLKAYKKCWACLRAWVQYEEVQYEEGGVKQSSLGWSRIM